MSGKLGIYDGISDPVDYVKEFNICNIMKSLNEATAITNLPVFVRGKALRVWDAVEASSQNIIAKIYAPLMAGCKQLD